MKLGVFGGTFNPPHVGHLIVAEWVRSTLELERILFVPAFIPPHKTDVEIVSAEHRIVMLQLSIADNAHFAISDFEIKRKGISFTVDTLRHLKETHDGELFLLIGMDNLLELATWKSPEEIFQLATVVVMTRPGFSLVDVPTELRDRVTICNVPEIGISSRELRRQVQEKKSIRYMVSASVEEYIRQHNLYKVSVNL